MVIRPMLQQVPPAPRLTNRKVDGLNWQYVDTTSAGGCSIVEWCEGQHPPYNGEEKIFHTRSIGSAMNDETSALPVEVMVAQWKAAPGVNWIAGASGPGWPNRDKAPQVGIFTYPAGGADDGMWLERPWGAPLVTALHGIGQHAFGDLLAVAIQFARELDEETKR